MPNQSPFDRPDVVCQVFHNRLMNLLGNLRAGYYFPGQKVNYLLHCIEYQERGMPHAHVVFQLIDRFLTESEECTSFRLSLQENFNSGKNGSAIDDHTFINLDGNDVNWINKYVLSAIPEKHRFPSNNQEAEDNIFHALVTKNMIHHHSSSFHVSSFFKTR
jgi:hypothetical protein